MFLILNGLAKPGQVFETPELLKIEILENNRLCLSIPGGTKHTWCINLRASHQSVEAIFRQ